jgi:serine/threonine-protein kinase HipA
MGHHPNAHVITRAAGGAQDHQPLTSIDFLLAVDDVSRVGALRFQDEEGVLKRVTIQGQRTAPPLIELSTMMTASRAVENNTETAEDLAYLRGRGTSLAGLRPKCTVIDADGALSIGKFPSIADERAVTKGEVLAMQLAKAAGINAPQARLIDSDGIPVTLISMEQTRKPISKSFGVESLSPSLLATLMITCTIMGFFMSRRTNGDYRRSSMSIPSPSVSVN